MTYATRSDIEGIYGAAHLETLVAADLDMNAAVAAACASASAEMDVYLGQRYSLPLTVVPSILNTWCIDIACWRLAPNIAQLSEEVRKRAERALGLLKDIAAGRGKIDALEPQPGSAGSEVSTSSSDGAFFSSRLRRFGGEGGGL